MILTGKNSNGAGASTFIDYLINPGFKNIIAADISKMTPNDAPLIPALNRH